MIDHDLDFDAHRDRADQAEAVRADHWLLLVALIADPDTESRRLAELLTAWPACVRRHRLQDDTPTRIERQDAALRAREATE